VKRIEFAPAARAELDAAADRYEQDYPGRGVRFYAAVERAVRLLVEFSGAAVEGFPFVLVYRDLGAVLRIDAVAHARRRPGYWKRRVR
jgi:hypothetical protein